MADLGDVIYNVSVWIVPVLIAITFHEAAHGWVAERLGDDTARRLGRVTFNPIRHIDKFGTIILPGLLLLMRAPFVFGWAKPVPVNFARLRHPKRDMIWVAAAGPAMNLCLALMSGWLMSLMVRFAPWLGQWPFDNLKNAILINVVLAVFNMLPLPPLDGGRVLIGLLPPRLALGLARVERYGFLILIGILFLLPMLGDLLGLDLNIFARIMWPAITLVLFGLSYATGLNLLALL